MPSDAVSSSGSSSDVRPQSRDGAVATRVIGRSSRVLSALEDLRRAASSATAAVAIANGSSGGSSSGARAVDVNNVKSFSPTSAASHPAAEKGGSRSSNAYESGSRTNAYDSGSRSNAYDIGSSAFSGSAGAGSMPTRGYSPGFGSGSSLGMYGSDIGSGSNRLGLYGSDGDDISRGRRNVSFSELAQVQQFRKDEILTKDWQQQQQQQQQQQHQHQQHQEHGFVIPEPPPRKR